MKATLTAAALGLALMSQELSGRSMIVYADEPASERGLAQGLIPGTLAELAAKASQGDPKRGTRLYESRCIACHSVDANRVGPMHRGVYGRKAGAVPDYNYSEAIKTSDVVWDAESLDRWLTNPNRFIPGSKMGFRVSKPGDRTDIIAFLESVSGQ